MAQPLLGKPGGRWASWNKRKCRLHWYSERGNSLAQAATPSLPAVALILYILREGKFYSAMETSGPATPTTPATAGTESDTHPPTPVTTLDPPPPTSKTPGLVCQWKRPPSAVSHQWQHRAASALFLVPVPDDASFPCTTEHA
jgi:hypothetical protein